MSTNAVIKVEGINYCALYKHWDGDPEATLPWLKEFNETFTKERPNDPEYKMAQLIRSSSRDAKKYHLDDSIYTGWGIVNTRNGDFEGVYQYVLNNDGSVSHEFIKYTL